MAGDYYELRVEGHLDGAWEGWFGGLAMRHTPDRQTALRLATDDQAALHGVLSLVRDLNLKLVAVDKHRGVCVPAGEEAGVKNDEG